MRPGAWYAGIGAGQVDLERLIPDEPPDEVTEDELRVRSARDRARSASVAVPSCASGGPRRGWRREAIADQKPSDRKRLLEFEPLRLPSAEARTATSVRTGRRRSCRARWRRRGRILVQLEPPDPHDLKVISSFLAEPPYGRLTIDEGTPEERAAQLLESQGALAAV